MPLKLSICKNENFGVTTEWEQVEVKKYSELVALMKMHPYSTAFFNEANEDQRQKFYEKYDSYPKGGYRSGKNVEAFGNLLVYDIDNDKYDKPLLIKEAKKLLESKKVSGIMMPSRSHNKPKKVSAEHQRKHGKPIIEEYHTAERFRIVIPINKPFKSIDLEHYREFQELTAKALGLEHFTDPKALKDRARFYYKSPIEHGYTEAKVERVMVIDDLSKVAIARVDQRRAEAKVERERIAEIRRDIQQYRQAPKATGNALTFADTVAIINQPITPLIVKFEHGKEFKDGSYNIVKTSTAKYSIVEENVAHDFKSDNNYNSLTYLQEQLGTNNLNIVARKLQEIDGNNYMIINYDAVKSVIGDAMKTATNDKTFEESVRQGFGVKYCKLEKDSIKIADQEIKLSEIELNKGDLIQAFKGNREVIKAKEEAEKRAQLKTESEQREKEESVAEAKVKAEAVKKAETKEVKKEDIKSTLDKEPKQQKQKQQGQSQGRGGGMSM